jgi:hypothetical protein
VARKVGTPKLREIAQFVSKHRRELAGITPPPTERKRSADEADMDELHGGAACERRRPKPPLLTAHASLCD